VETHLESPFDVGGSDMFVHLFSYEFGLQTEIREIRTTRANLSHPDKLPARRRLSKPQRGV
jgi:hypothetical protein